MSGGMQAQAIKTLYCKCGKKTSKLLILADKEISIHFTKKTIYWHIYNKKTQEIKRVFKMPIEWE